MEQAELERVRVKFESEVRSRFAGAAIGKVELLQYGDAPEIEPGELLGKIVIAVPEGADASDKEVRRAAMESFQDANREAIRGLQKVLRERGGAAILQFSVHGSETDPDEHGPVFKMKVGGRSGGPGFGGDPSLTPVMARVGHEDLETLDTLIAAGIAGSRAEAVRWALARIRERPAYAQIRARSREIEDLKSQF
jgi:hypothetical protein